MSSSREDPPKELLTTSAVRSYRAYLLPFVYTMVYVWLDFSRLKIDLELLLMPYDLHSVTLYATGVQLTSRLFLPFVDTCEVSFHAREGWLAAIDPSTCSLIFAVQIEKLQRLNGRSAGLGIV